MAPAPSAAAAAAAASAASTGEAIRVVVRCRPFNAREKAGGYKKTLNVDKEAGTVTLLNPNKEDEPPKVFSFDSAFDDDTEQMDFYNRTARPIVESVLEGYNGTVFAYGQTGTGKTFSMEGVREVPELRGIIPNSFNHIFSYIGNTSDKQFLVRVSYLEIYNEEVRDLLGKNPKARLDLKENPDTGVYVKDLSAIVVKSVEEIDAIMNQGNKNRSIGATDMNAHSSRSHSIFTVTIESSEKVEGGEDLIKAGKLHLVDLAGSERQSKTGATGDRLKEATKINLSLSALGNCISALVDGKSSHIPYRDSKLTRLLQDSLGGNAKTMMIATMSPATFNFDETLSTLRYANRAKNIKNKPKINEDPKDAMLRQYQEEIELLKKRLLARIQGGTGPEESVPRRQKEKKPKEKKEKVKKKKIVVVKTIKKVKRTKPPTIDDAGHVIDEELPDGDQRSLEGDTSADGEDVEEEEEGDAEEEEEEEEEDDKQEDEAEGVDGGKPGEEQPDGPRSSEAARRRSNGGGDASGIKDGIAADGANGSKNLRDNAADDDAEDAEDDDIDDEINQFSHLNPEEMARMQAEIEREKQLLLNSKGMLESEKQRLVSELEDRAQELERERQTREALQQKLRAIEERLLVGGVNIVDKVNSQQMELERRAAEIEEQKRKERELQRQLEARQETALQMEEHYASLQEEVEVKSKKLKKLVQKLQAAKSEISDLQDEFRTEREDLLDTIRELSRELSLKTIIIDNFIPQAERDKIEKRATYDDERDEWGLQRLTNINLANKLKRPLATTSLPPNAPLGLVGCLRRPVCFMAKINSVGADANPRFRPENIITLKLDMPERTTRDYEGPGTNCPPVQTALETSFPYLQVAEEESLMNVFVMGANSGGAGSGNNNNNNSNNGSSNANAVATAISGLGQQISSVLGGDGYSSPTPTPKKKTTKPKEVDRSASAASGVGGTIATAAGGNVVGGAGKEGSKMAAADRAVDENGFPISRNLVASKKRYA